MAALLHLNEVRQLANVQDVDSFYMFVFKMLPCDKVSTAFIILGREASCADLLDDPVKSLAIFSLVQHEAAGW